MSKLSDYSKFDHLDSDSDDEPEQAQPSSSKSATAAPMDVNSNETTGTVAPAPAPTTTTTSIMQQHPTLPQRYIYLHHEKGAVYEWEQSMQEVIIYIAAPDFLLRDPKLIACQITSSHLQLGQQQQVANQKSYFLDQDIWQTVNVKDSTWCIEDEYICIYLQKANKGIVWEAALKGEVNKAATATVTLNPTQLQYVQQRLMLERFQEENPGMDFRDATFNGSVPDPRTFMGGVKH
jgi:hypothetical protein